MKTSKQVVKTTVVTTTSTSKPTSKPSSKTPSQSQSKKVEIQKVVVKSDGDEIKDAFELFDSNGEGKINVREIRGAMQSIGYDEKNPTVYEVITELDNPRSKNSGGATFNDFCQTVNYRVPEKEQQKILEKYLIYFLMIQILILLLLNQLKELQMN